MRLHNCLPVAHALLGLVHAQTYDYVIAGAGTSGLLLGVALSADPSVTVAVLEAGLDGRSDTRITVPENEGKIQGTIYDWNFTTVPQPGLSNSKTVPAQRGKTIGGTSAMHWMIWNQASKTEYDGWQDTLGISGWNWSVIDSARRRAEAFTPPPETQANVTRYNAAYHGTKGPIGSMMQKSWYSLFTDYVLPSLKNLGVPAPQDKDDGVQTNGVSFAPLSIDNATYTRAYSGSAYTAVQGRMNLKVITSATVSRILWTGTTEPVTAKGVEYYARSSSGSSTKSTITARKQVILGAGSLQSAQILELSGVGDPAVLSPLGISPVVNLPAVGTQLQDHMTFAGSFSFKNSSFSGGGYASAFMDYANATRLLEADYKNASQMLSSSTPPAGVTSVSWKMFKKLFATDQPLVEFAWYYNYVNMYLLHPLSSGTVHAASSDPLAAPRIDPAYNNASLSNGLAWDLWLLSKAARYLATTVAHAKPLADNAATFSVNASLPFDQFEAQVRKGLGSGQHFTGGAILGPRAAGGVVDSNLLVYGTRNVRVVDLSVVPFSPGQHPMGLAYSIAMRAAAVLQAGG